MKLIIIMIMPINNIAQKRWIFAKLKMEGKTKLIFFLNLSNQNRVHAGIGVAVRE
jgi:hypothetical protein